jgi:hypothetical protein
MKLNKDIKKRIDTYFENIKAQDLFDIAVNKYGFKVNNNIDLNNQSFDIIAQEFYNSITDTGVEVKEVTSMPLAA